MKATDAYYHRQSDTIQACLLSVRAFILDCSPHFSESIKWGIPCFSYGKYICCYLNVNRKNQQPYILFAHGQQLQHPLLEQGARKKMKSLPVPTSKDLPLKVIQEILQQAINSDA